MVKVGTLEELVLPTTPSVFSFRLFGVFFPSALPGCSLLLSRALPTLALMESDAETKKHNGGNNCFFKNHSARF